MKRLVLIDSNAIIHRAYHALPKNLSNQKGELTNVTYGFALALIKILEEIHPDYIAAAFDLAAPTFRHIEYKEYKATRVKADQELYDQIPRVREMLTSFGIPIYAIEGFEADDVIGTIVEYCNGHNKKCQIPGDDLEVFIASGDRDVYQLLNGHVKVLMLKHGFKEAEIFDANHLKEVYNLEPEDFIDLKALMGDASDNIPGIPGIGPKTATELLNKFGTLEKLYEQIHRNIESGIKNQGRKTDMTEHFNSLFMILDSKSQKQMADDLGVKERILGLLIKHKDQAFQSKMLATIRRDAPIEFELAKAKWGQYDKDELRKLFEELEFRSLLRRFGKDFEDQTKMDNGQTDDRQQTTPEQKKKDEQLRLEL